MIKCVGLIIGMLFATLMHAQLSEGFAVLYSGDTVYYRVAKKLNKRDSSKFKSKHDVVKERLYHRHRASYLEYYAEDKNGKRLKINLKNIKYAKIDSSIYLGFLVKKNKSKLFEILAFNTNHILLRTFFENTYFKIYDRKTNKVHYSTFRFNTSAEIDEQLATYFNDCSNLLEKMKSNLKASKSADSGIFYQNCSNVPDLVEDIVN